MEDKYIILFDGVCNLCNGLVNFLIKRDKKDYFRFSSLQSAEGQDLLNQHQLPTSDFHSLVLSKNGKVYQKSGAGIRILARLGGLWRLMKIFVIIPRPLRDLVYSFIAKNRYRFWGKKDQCMIPTPELKAKFL